MLEQLTFLYSFDPLEPARSALDVHNPTGGFPAPADPADGFTITLRVDLRQFEDQRTLLDMPGVLRVRLRRHDPLDRSRQNYPAFRMPDGSVPVLEADLALHSAEHSDWRGMVIGIPLAMLDAPWSPHEIVLSFTGVRWTIFVDGLLLDNDFPFGYPPWNPENSWRVDSEYVREAALFFPAVKPSKSRTQQDKTPHDIQYWTPPGHNCWAGDVATIFHDGRYHVFYLYDRRHHQSRFGAGAHYFEHLSSADLRTWVEHEAATPLEEQWECIGTGAPFVFRGNLCLSYGLHTTRIYPREETLLPAQWQHLDRQGCTGRFDTAESPGAPAGSTYAVSEDRGLTFKKSRVLFHPCENPSVYTDPEGRLRLLANAGSKGIWQSQTVEGGWRCISPDFPPGGDCTFYFRWGGYDYIIGGFTGLWSKPADDPISAYEDQVARGLDFYDGSNVPAVSEIPGARFLMAAWIPITGWGGNLVLRELIQMSGGRIGSKWLDEVTPETDATLSLSPCVADTAVFPAPGRTFLLRFTLHLVDPAKARSAVVFLPDGADPGGCELRVSPASRRAQFAPGASTGFAEREKSLREGGAPHHAANYAIENLVGVDEPFTVRVIVKGCDKIGGSLIDAEIAGCRTMLSYRPGLTVRNIAFRAESVELRDIEVGVLRENGL